MESDESDNSDDEGDSTSDESVAKGGGDFDDDDDDDDEEDAEEEEDEDADDDEGDASARDRPSPAAAMVAAAAAPRAAPPAAAPTPAPPPVAAGLSVDALKAMCQPCCAQLSRFLLANDGLLNGTTRWERLEDDHRLLHEATTVETVVAASLSLARTLMDAHTDPPEEAVVLVSARERARMRARAETTAAFAEATLVDLDRAIAESRAQTERLEGTRKRGYEALEAVEGGGVGEGPSV